MAQITTRITSGGGATVKNDPLTNTEIDNNFINLNVDKIEQNDAVSTNTADKVVRRDNNGDFAANQVTVSSIKTGSVTYPTTNATQAEMEAGTNTSTKYVSPERVKQAIDVLSPIANANISLDLTGFENRSTSSLTFNESTRTLTLTPIGDCVVYRRGVKKVISSPISLQFPNSSIGRYINYDFDNNQLVVGNDTPDILGGGITVSYIYWDAVNGRAIIVADERHLASRDTQWHYTQHRNIGAIWRSGGEINYSTQTQSTIGIGLATPLYIADEELEHTISHNPTPTGYYNQLLNNNAALPVLYLQGSSYVTTLPATAPWIAGSSNARYNSIANGSGSLADATNGFYVGYWIVATNDMLYPVKAIMGRSSHATVDAAANESFYDYGLPFAEIVPLYQVILHTSTTYVSNSAHVVIAAVKKITTNSISSGFIGISHNTLSNLGNDDHAQYLHINSARTVTATHTFSAPQQFTSTSYIQLPSGNTVQRPAGLSNSSYGYVRYNTDLADYEKWNGTTWEIFGGLKNSMFHTNDQTITYDFTLAGNKNAMTAGPVTINNGVTVTISDGATWTVV